MKRHLTITVDEEVFEHYRQFMNMNDTSTSREANIALRRGMNDE